MKKKSLYGVAWLLSLSVIVGIVACTASTNDQALPVSTPVAVVEKTAPASEGETATLAAIATPTASTPVTVASPTSVVLPTAVPPSPTSTPPLPTQTPVAPPGSVEVHFIDVGQGDAILILAPDGEAMLIDGGEAGSGVLRYLRSKGVQQLDLMVATHPHSDHIGGLEEVLQAIPVAEVVTNGQPHTTRTYERLLDAIDAAKAQYREVKRGDSLQLGSITLEVLHPTSTTGSNLNNQSVVLRMVHGKTVFLFTGDAEREAEASMSASSFRPVSATVLKVSHHGGRTASSPAFLELVKPEVAVYSAGEGNTYGHPHPEALAALTEVGAKVYGTDTHGTVTVTSDGTGYTVATSKDTQPRAPPVAAFPTPVSAASQPTTTTAPTVPTVTPVPAPGAELTIGIVSVTSPVRPGDRATLMAKTAPGARSTITVHYQSGPSKAQGLDPKDADAEGNVSWTWTVGAGTAEGTWRVVVTASKDGKTVTKETAFAVAK